MTADTPTATTRRPLSGDLARIGIDAYNRKLDGVTTAWVAERYQITQSRALRALKRIVKGEIYHPTEYPFGDYCPLMCGVGIRDGSTFTFGDDCDYGEGRRGAANHYNWFCN